jgi:putative phosphoesterase
MQLALISDVHANFEALSVLADVLGQVDQVLCLGDLIGYYCQVNEVIDYIRNLNARCVLGNHDSFLFRGVPPNVHPHVRFGIEFARRVITDENADWLKGLPLTWGGFIGGRSFLLVHGSPWRPLGDYLYSDNPSSQKLDAFGYDVIAFGQTHRAVYRLERAPYLLNPGSVGQSRDERALACMFVFDTESMTVRKIERRFDAEKVIDLAKRNGAGEWIGKHLG